MPRSKPYQPLLLRSLHGLNAIIAILALVSAFLVYNQYDHRLIKLPLPAIPDIIGIHGTFGLTLLLIMPFFALYSFHWGSNRLIQSDFFTKLNQVNKPAWWYGIHRVVNTLMLIAVTWALISGRQMKEEWLPAGELNHIWYTLHLCAWVIVLLCLITHLTMGIKVGGIPLLLSMYSWGYRENDSPKLWLKKITNFRRKKP